jgi:hypothetical protein
MTPEKILGMLDERAEEEVQANLVDLAEMAGDEDEDRGLRCYAVKVLGRLKRPDEKVIDALGNNVTSSTDSTVRAWSAWALGALNTPRSLSYLNNTLRKGVGPVIGYFALEALGKLYKEILVDPEVQEQTLLALNAFSANLKETLPSVYGLLDKTLANLEFRVSILKKELDLLKRTGSDERAKKNVYWALYKLLSHMTERKDQIAAGAEKMRLFLEAAHEMIFAKEIKTSRSMSMMAALGLGRSCDRHILASLAAPGVSTLYTVGAPSVRVIAAWSLLRLQLYAPKARELLRSRVLQNETEPQIFRLMADMNDKTDEFDAIQKLFNLDVDG